MEMEMVYGMGYEKDWACDVWWDIRILNANCLLGLEIHCMQSRVLIGGLRHCDTPTIDTHRPGFLFRSFTHA